MLPGDQKDPGCPKGKDHYSHDGASGSGQLHKASKEGAGVSENSSCWDKVFHGLI